MIHKLNRILSIIILMFSVLIIYSGITYAQGKMVGKVVDLKTKEPIYGASVVLVGTNIGAPTDPAGEFIIVNVPVGTYSVQATMIGTNKVVKTGVVVSEGRTTRVDFELEETTILGQEVVVTAKQDILHKEVSGSQIVSDNQQIREAAGVRTLQDFLATQAGVTGVDYLTIRGGLPAETGTVINGLTYVNERVGMAQSFIPTSAVEQVSLKSGGMTAEYGDFRSGVINVTTKTGSNSGYHGSFSFSSDPAHMKRFGPSMQDPMNNYLRPHLDPDIAFIGVDAAIQAGYITAYDKQQFVSWPSFAGFNTIAKTGIPAGWSQSLTAGIASGRYPAGTVITPVNLYLYDAWMHLVNPDWDKLNAKIDQLNALGLNVGTKITDQNLKNLFSSHTLKEGQYADFNFDGGFGGPIPLIGKELGDATFYLSNITKRTSYMQPNVELPYDLNSSTVLSIKSNITSTITLKLTGVYGYEKGMNSARGADSEPASLAVANNLGSTVYTGMDRGAMMPEDNTALFVGGGSNFNGYFWALDMLQPWIEKNYLVGLDLTHAISNTTFYNLTASYQATKENINPENSRMRDLNVLGYAGPIPLTEQPYGRRILNVFTNQQEDTVAGWRFDQFYAVPGLATDRYDSKGGVFYDNSLTQQLRIKLSFGSQISKMHFIKAGIEYSNFDINNNRWSYWPTQGPASMYEYNFKVSPTTFGAYIQDEITFEDMVANFGVRMDNYSFGNLKWPTGNPWDGAAFAAPNWTPADYLAILQSGRSIIWERWNSLNDQYIAAGQPPLLQSVDSKLVFSPRVGISFPITERAKFYFNYGHFRSLPPLSEMFTYDFRYDPSKGGIVQLGNPNLQPSKTIQYELGVDYNLLDQYLLHISGYYKDVTGDVRVLTYTPTTAGITTYRFRTNDSYRTIQGLEIQITKNVGEILTGWLNMQYVYASGGNTGRSAVFQDPSSNVAASAFTYANPSRPDPVPQIRANINLKSPHSWGDFLGDWNLSLLPSWQLGSIFRFNPRNVDGANNEFRWPNFWMVNLKFSKSFDIGLFKATAYVNVNNLFNNKIFQQNWAFAGGVGQATGTDYNNYMASLHLTQYSGSYWDAIRDETKDLYLYPGYVYKAAGTNATTGYVHNAGDVVGEDKVGDLRSSGKPWINDPNVDLFTFGMTRSVWFGIQFDF